MKTLTIIKPALALFFVITASLGLAKAQTSKNLSLSNFSEVSVSSGIELHVIQGNTESARIVANSDVINEVKIEKSGNSIKIGWKENWGFNKMWKNKHAKVYLTYKKLSGIAASSGSSIKTDNQLTTDRLNLKVASGCHLDAKISCQDLQVQASSGCDADLSGKATNLSLSAASGCSIDAFDLVTEYARVNTSSGSDVKINVTKGLEANTSSGSNIRYKGTASVKKNTDKSSSVSQAD